MNITEKEFAEKIVEEIYDAYGLSASVVTTEKATGEKIGVTISKPKLKSEYNPVFSPIIYTEDFYQQYCAAEQGIIENAVKEVMSIYDKLPEQCDAKSMGLVQNLPDYEAVKDSIYFELIMKEYGEHLKKSGPCVEFLDMSKVFYVLVNVSGGQVAKTRVNNSFLDAWGVDVAQIDKAASVNTPRLFPAIALEMKDLLQRVLSSPVDTRKADEDFMSNLERMKRRSLRDGCDWMLVLSNNTRLLGASVILYDSLLETVRNQMDRDLAILPSSRHEVIVVPYEGEERLLDFKEMVREVNDKEVEPDDLLSYSVYVYDENGLRIGA